MPKVSGKVNWDARCVADSMPVLTLADIVAVVPQDSSARDDAGQEGALPHRRVTANMLVSYNLAYFRKACGLTQKQLGASLGGWSEASVSVAERGWDGRRIRKFDADEMTRIAAVLGVPIVALLLPPEDAGTAVDYFFDAGADRLLILDGMLREVLPPYEGDTPAMAAFRERVLALGGSSFPRPGPAEAEQVIAQAKADADAVLAEADREAERRIEAATEHAEALVRDARLRADLTSRHGPGGEQAAELIVQARHEADETLGRARREADDILTKARRQSEQITSDARARAENLERDARERHRQALDSLVQSRQELEQRIDDLRAFERGYRSGLMAYLDSLRDGLLAGAAYDQEAALPPVPEDSTAGDGP